MTRPLEPERIRRGFVVSRALTRVSPTVRTLPDHEVLAWHHVPAWMGMGGKPLGSRCDLRQVADSFDSPAEALFWCARFGVASAFEPHRAPRSGSVAVDQFLYLGREL